MKDAAIQAPSNIEERGWLASPATYLVIAAVAAAATLIAGTLFPFALAISIWSLFSAAIIVLHRRTEGTRFEKAVRKIYASLLEVNAMPVKIFLLPLTFFGFIHRPIGSLKGRPILMLNGYLSFGSMWIFHKRKLAKAGLGPIYTMNIGSYRSITIYAQHVKAKLQEIQKETGRKDIILIGHSKGGLVSAFFATSLSEEIGADVTDIITIGSPLAGTPIAHFALGRDAKEMKLDSEFHVVLRNQINQCVRTRFYHIGSELDTIVPYKSALIGEKPEQQLFIKDTGHVALLFSSRVSDQICKWLLV